MDSDRLCHVAVSSAVYSIDKPYVYLLPEFMWEFAGPGMRVIVPFSRSNRKVEGMILDVFSGERKRGIKAVAALLDDRPVLSQEGIRLALWMRERYHCTVYEAVKAMLPAGLYFSLKNRYRVAPDVDRERIDDMEDQPVVQKILDLLWSSGGSMEKETLLTAFGETAPHRTIKALLARGILTEETSASRSVGDKVEQRVALAVPAEDALSAVSARSHSQRAVIQLLSDLPDVSVKDVKYFTGCGISTIKALEKRGLVRMMQREVFRRPIRHTAGPAEKPVLTQRQEECLTGLEQLMFRPGPECALLYGVTGSGKTQVYICLIHAALEAGKSALVLVPEIALTPQLLDRFTAQFGDGVAVLHSMLSPGERYDEWKRVRSGRARVVLGTRSAVFAPMENLGLIVLDEEQEASYKSENTPRYHARDVAKYRVSRSDALLLLGSATPLAESMYRARRGDYHLFTLSERYNRRALPHVMIADMKEELRAGNDPVIGTVLRRELETNLQREEQSILFINRRGTSRMVICSQCGESPACPRCSVKLTYHKANGRLMCHYCGHSQPLPPKCPDCGGELIFFGAGTQRVQEEVQELFPGVEVMRMDTDTVSASRSHEKMLDRFLRQKVPVLVGTQMVAKGLDFESVTLVGVISADQSLYVEDYRSAERTFSLLTQVVGRAGRGNRTGRAVIQTYTPKNDVILCAAEQNYDRFYESEIALREARGMPPFRDLYIFTVSGTEEGAVLSCCVRLAEGIRLWQDSPEFRACALQVLGPAAAPVLMVNNRYRYRVTVLGRSGPELRKMVSHILKTAHEDPANRGVSVVADLNPMD